MQIPCLLLLCTHRYSMDCRLRDMASHVLHLHTTSPFEPLILQFSPHSFLPKVCPFACLHFLTLTSHNKTQTVLKYSCPVSHSVSLTPLWVPPSPEGALLLTGLDRLHTWPGGVGVSRDRPGQGDPSQSPELAFLPAAVPRAPLGLCRWAWDRLVAPGTGSYLGCPTCHGPCSSAGEQGSF